jgi:NAD(P)H-dependent FMN reductase
MHTPCRARRNERGENCCTKVLVPPGPFGSTRTMPLFAEEASPPTPSKNEVAQRWQKKVDEFDAFIFTAAEYNRGPTGLMHDAMI